MRLANTTLPAAMSGKSAECWFAGLRSPVESKWAAVVLGDGPGDGVVVLFLRTS
jgi:hypothetical protein